MLHPYPARRPRRIPWPLIAALVAGSIIAYIIYLKPSIDIVNPADPLHPAIAIGDGVQPEKALLRDGDLYIPFALIKRELDGDEVYLPLEVLTRLYRFEASYYPQRSAVSIDRHGQALIVGEVSGKEMCP